MSIALGRLDGLADRPRPRLARLLHQVPKGPIGLSVTSYPIWPIGAGCREQHCLRNDVDRISGHKAEPSVLAVSGKEGAVVT